MDKIIDFSNSPIIPRTLGGSDKKFRVLYNNEYYMLKFTEEHIKKTDLSTSHENNAISEYLSSHISQSIGLPTHDTVLGIYKNDEVCVGCKDFRTPYDENIDFDNFMRTIYDKSDVKKIPKLFQIYEVIESEAFPEYLRDDAIERYWDTFIIDALVGNFDRHTGNWGLLFNAINQTYSLAPVYDYGSTLFPIISDKSIKDVIENKIEIAQRCLLFPSATLHITEEKTGKVGYYDMLASNYDSNCTKSLLKIFPKINLNTINEIIDNTPLISDERRAFYKNIINARYHIILEKAYNLCIEQNYDVDSFQRIAEGDSITKATIYDMINNNKIDTFYLLPISTQMEQIWQEFFNKPKNERRSIEWNNQQYRIAVFEDIYLLQCKEEGKIPEQAINNHFWNNCVACQDYEPRYCNRAEISI